MVKAEIGGTGFLFVTVYASNIGHKLVKMVSKLAQHASNPTIVKGGGWKSTRYFTLDRNKCVSVYVVFFCFVFVFFLFPPAHGLGTVDFMLSNNTKAKLHLGTWWEDGKTQ